MPTLTRKDVEGWVRPCLGKALLLEGLRRMQTRGAHLAHVEADSTNEASQRLYMNAGGFQMEYRALKYYREC